MNTHMSLDCDGFAAALADYLEGDSPIAVREAMESHATGCVACRELLDDLNAIRLDAAALPVLAPTRDLWSGIAERIDAKVVPIGTRERTIVTTRRSWARPAIAAAALVVVTAGITHFATRASLKNAASTAPTGSTPFAVSPESLPMSVASVAPVSKGTGGEMTSTQTERTSSPNRSRTPAAGSPVARLASAEPLMRETEPVYDREILKLRSIVKTRRAQLDPKTVAVLEQSIAVIDSAIAQSRAALSKDPASGFLATQLNHSLEKKVELLRTAALLPART
jgi:hypothetical protein